MRVIDSHTEGEPTRLIVDGGPPLGTGPLALRRERFARDFDDYRRFAVNEPRGSDAVVGALLCEPEDPTAAAGLIFFNNTGYLGMCGHATIGAAVTLARMGRIGPGRHLFETPVGPVTVLLDGPNAVTIENVPSFRHRAGVAIEVDGLGTVVGDVAWGGNWFFLAEASPLPLEMAHIPGLIRAAEAVARALAAAGITGTDGAAVDHVEFFGPPAGADAHSRNFVLCPGGAYDRSPCGTGTSAKLACLAAGGKLAPGVDWVQESIVGSRFTARYRLDEAGRVIPSITGRAYVVAEATLLRDPGDPFANGIVPLAA
ncbi:proline racemase family protein [Prosthecodimorpha staleyi]|uniref:4-hydroxyproline epimerase n=1 Tax=Prosthecodimorpha staleyi TaxID=2840188 RepID=A0A947GF95_9HYPH|nr:proline racemase family protein [Prosthecodimorpha staleyi]MBT9292922.1 proline racemase family protein [Prosthecodimorpha staleyi]